MLRKIEIVTILVATLSGCGPTLSERSTSMSCAELDAMCTSASVTLQQPPPPPPPPPSRKGGFAYTYPQDKYRRDTSAAQYKLEVCLNELAKRCPREYASVTSRF